MIIKAYSHIPVNLGRVGENGVRTVEFDVAAYQRDYPEATIYLLNQIPGSAAAYPVAGADVRGSKLLWTVASSDVSAKGRGKCEIIVEKDGAVLKSVIYDTETLEALDDSGTTPSPWESWLTQFDEKVQEAEAQVGAAAEQATLAESWAVGGTDTRTGEDTNNSEYWSGIAETQAQAAAESAAEAAAHGISASVDGNTLILSRTEG